MRNCGTSPVKSQFDIHRRDKLRSEAIRAINDGDWGVAIAKGTVSHRLTQTFYPQIEKHPDMLVESILLAVAHTQSGGSGDWPKATEYLQEAGQLAALTPYEDLELNAVVFLVLGQVAAMVRSNDAASWVQPYIKTLTIKLGPGDMMVADAWVHATQLYLQLGLFDEALDAASQALLIRERLLGPKHPLVADARYNVGMVHLRLGSAEEALTRFITALHLHSAQDTIQRVRFEYGLAMAQHQAGKYGAARMSYDEALQSSVAILGSLHPVTLEIEDCMEALKEDEQ